MSSRIVSITVNAVLVTAATYAAAYETPTELDRMLVTETRTAFPVAESLSPSQIIDHVEIERSQATSLQELLKGRAGITLVNSGGPGKQTSLFLRGTNSNQTLIMVDGVRVSSATTGAATLQDLPLAQIDRVEIVRGPRSSLYGADAIGGVIQIFTKTAGRGLQQNLRLGAGSHRLREVDTGFSYGGENSWIAVQGAFQDTDGIDACRGTASGFGAGCFVEEPDRDGYRNTSLSVRGGSNIADTMIVEGHFLNVASDLEYDGDRFAGNESEGLQRIAGGKLKWQPDARLEIQLDASRSWDRLDSYQRVAGHSQRLFVSAIETRRDSASLQSNFILSEKRLLVTGVDWYEDRVTSSTVYDRSKRHNTGLFAEYLTSWGEHQLQVSLRNDDNQQFGNHLTGSAGWGMSFGNGFKVTANFGTGFRAPTFNDLYYPYFGNPNLDPEESKSLDIGVSRVADHWRWSLNVYETRIDELISYDPTLRLPNNIDKARIRGAEWTASLTWSDWHFSTQLSYVDPRNRGNGMDRGNWLPRRARHSARLDADRTFGKFNAGVTLTGYGRRYDDAANDERLSGYATIDLRLEYAISPQWTVQARAANLFDREYETVAWFNQPGREYGLSIRYRSDN